MNYELSPTFAYKLLILIETGVVNPSDYYAWSERIIAELDDPPLWVIDLSMEKNPHAAATIIRNSVVNPNLDALKEFNFKDFFAASYFVKAEQGELSWSDLLLQSGICAEGPDASIPVDEFYNSFKEYSNSKNPETIKKAQTDNIKSKLKNSIQDVYNTLEKLKKHI